MLLEIKGSHIDSLPFESPVLQYDILSFEDNPVLSHYKDSNGNDLLFYWIDYTKDGNRWLVWKVLEGKILDYLHRNISLKELMLSSDGFYFFVLDYDIKGEFEKGCLLTLNNIPESYFPDDNSFYDYSFPDFYKNYFKEEIQASTNLYLRALRQNGIDFTLKPKTPRFGETVSTKDAIDFLNGITKSYNEYTEYSFFEAFKNTTSDFKKLKKTYNSLHNTKQLRISDLSFSSFNITLSSDTLTRDVDIDKQYDDWNKEVLDNYKNEVIDNNFNEEEDAKAIAEKFPDPDLRKRIFEPIIKIIESTSVNLEISNADKSIVRKFRGIDQKFKDIIIVAPSIEDVLEEMHPKRKIIQVYMEVPEDENIGDKSLSKKKIKENLLFSQETNGFPVRIDDIRFGNTLFVLKKPLLLSAVFANDVYHLDFFTLDIHVESEDKDQLVILFNAAFFEKYYQLTNETSESEAAKELTEIVGEVKDNDDSPF